MRLCMCGCGRQVRLRFFPGHDGKLMHKLCVAVRTRTQLEINGITYDSRGELVDYAYEVSPSFGRRFVRILRGEYYR